MEILWLLKSVTKICILLLLPPANVVCEGYVFTGVCLSTGGKGDPPGRETPHPPGKETPLARKPPWQGDPPDKETPLAGRLPTPWQGDPPGKETPLARRPPWQGDPPARRHPPGKETPPSMCGRYASYWNAFLFLIPLKAVCKTEWNTFCDYVKENKQREGDRMKVSGYDNRQSFHECGTVHDISL